MHLKTQQLKTQHLRRNTNAAPPRQHRRLPRSSGRRDWIEGTLVELDAQRQSLTVRVGASSRPLAAIEPEVVVDASSARISAGDGDGDGRPNLTDLFPGDRVRVTLERGSALTAWRVDLVSIAGPRGGLRRLWHS